MTAPATPSRLQRIASCKTLLSFYVVLLKILPTDKNVNSSVDKQNKVSNELQCDNGSEFISREVDRRVYENKVTLDFSRPGKSTDNPYVESFNGKFRDECLSVNWFVRLEDAQEKMEDWHI